MTHQQQQPLNYTESIDRRRDIIIILFLHHRITIPSASLITKSVTAQHSAEQKGGYKVVTI